MLTIPFNDETLITELQIIFEPNAYLQPTFWLDAEFQNFKWYFHHLYFFAMLKREVILFLAYICCFVSFWTYLLKWFAFACGIILQMLVFVITLVVTQRKPMTICLQTDRQMDLFNPEFYFCFSFNNCYALLWTPYAYRDMLMHIFTPCLFLQCVFADFQCVITLLRALSVALLSKIYFSVSKINKLLLSQSHFIRYKVNNLNIKSQSPNIKY